MASKSKERVPKKMQSKFEAITEFTDAFCKEHLSDEYAELCQKLVARLCRKRPSPLERGKLEIWACAMVYTVGRVNFLFDPSQTPHMRADQICQIFGISQSSASVKSKMIMDMLNIVQLDPQWSLPSQLADNPMAWMIEVNGFILDVRYAPREIQEKAFRLGLIPFLPERRE